MQKFFTSELKSKNDLLYTELKTVESLLYDLRSGYPKDPDNSDLTHNDYSRFDKLTDLLLAVEKFLK